LTFLRRSIEKIRKRATKSIFDVFYPYLPPMNPQSLALYLIRKVNLF
jgi:hypothetical protein